VKLPISLMLLLALLSDVHRVGGKMIFQRINETQIIVIALRPVFFVLGYRIPNSLMIHYNFWFKAQLDQEGLNKSIHHAESRKENRIKQTIKELKIKEQKVSEEILRKII